MESNGLPGGMFSGIGSGMLGLEMPLHPQSQPQQNPHHLHHHPHTAAFAHHDHPDHHHSQSQQSAKQFLYAPKPKQPQAPLSDEDEPAFTPDDSTGDNKRKMSPWQRMKWTDNMVRLLIMAVYYIGDEGGSEGSDKKKPGGLLQKKGKWKSVSRAMMEKGFFVSPQQCEDKFNDLNKRYKRVNDILGKGTACKVVENQNLLDAMDLSPNFKEEVRKLLNSKHLFFREMCAYHNSCGHGNSVANEVGAEPSNVHQQQGNQNQQQCLHSSENAQIGANSSRAENEGSKMVKGGSSDEDDDDNEDEDDEEEDEEHSEHGHGHEENDDNEERCSRKRPRRGLSIISPLMQQLSSEVMGVVQDGNKSLWEKKQWMRTRLLQFEEHQVSYQCQAFELEKQRLKWVKFSSKKEREMERAKLENERRRIENERMVLLIRQKEVELFDLHQQQHSSNKRGDPSSVTG